MSMTSLYLALKHLPENLPDGAKDKEYLWGKLEIFVDDGLEKINLFSVEYRLIYFVNWYLEMHLPNLYRPCWLNDLKAEESVAQAVMRPAFYNQRNSSHEFINVHLAPINLRRAFSYFEPIPQILISRRSTEAGNPNEGEISLFGRATRRNHAKIAIEDKAQPWAYRFDLRQYHQDSRWEMVQFLEEWTKIAPTERSKESAQKLFQQILDSPEA